MPFCSGFYPLSFFAIYSIIYSFFLCRLFCFFLSSKSNIHAFFLFCSFCPYVVGNIQTTVSSSYTVKVLIYSVCIYSLYLGACSFIVYSIFVRTLFLCAPATLRRGALSSLATLEPLFDQKKSSAPFAVPFCPFLAFLLCVPHLRPFLFALLPFLAFQTFATFILYGF